MTDRRTDGQTDGGDNNIPFAFLKKRRDKKTIRTLSQNKAQNKIPMDDDDP